MASGAARNRHASPRAALLLAGALLAAAGARALQASDVAGSLNGEPVSLAEVDEALDGSLRKSWAEMHQIVRAAARALCAERSVARLAAEAGTDALGWRAAIWSGVEPGPDEVEAYVRDHPEVFAGSDPDARLVAHRLRVTRYRGEIARRTGELLAGAFVLDLPEAPAVPEGAPLLPARVATCFGSAIGAEDVERLASFPLYRRRAEVVTSTCRQFEIDHSNPLLLKRLAKSKQLSVSELMQHAEGTFDELPPEQVEAIARQRYGRADPGTLVRARLALEAQRRLAGRMAVLEGLRKSAVAECALSLPPPPTVSLRGQGSARGPSGALRVVLFGSFACQHCRVSFEILEALEARFAKRIQVEFRHHFPDTLLPPFEDAVSATCSGTQGRFFEFASARFATTGPAPVFEMPLDIDPGLLRECLRDPRTAVSVLNDTEEALRLGFRDALPSWVVGRRPRRGFQGEQILAKTIEQQIGRGDE